MKSSTKKRLIALMLCMVLVISNSISILADAPEAETASVEQTTEKATEKAKETTTEAKKETKASEKKEEAITEAKKEEKASEEKKEEKTEEEKTTSEEKKGEATTEAKKEEKTSTEEEKTTSEEKKETTTEKKEEQKAAEEVTTEAKAEETTTEAAKEDTTEEVEEEATTAQTLTYENNEVIVNVSAKAENSIPEGATLKVVPVLKDNSETAQQYQEVEQKIQEKAAETETEITGFLAYDISLIDKEGSEVEPNGNVQVSMEYKESVIPAEATEPADTTVTVMHLEEDKDGQIKEVVDMSKSNQLENIETTEEQKVQKAEFVTDSFSVYTITWTRNSRTKTVNFHYVDNNGKDIPGLTGTLDVDGNKNNTIDLSNYQTSIDDYTYAGTYLNSYDSNQSVTKLKIESNRYYCLLYYYDDKDKQNIWLPQDTYYNIYFVYTKNTTPPSGGSGGSGGSSGSTLGAPAHQKYIKKNTDDNYTLTLDVTGEQGAATPIDILLIVDKSGSMNDNNNERYKNVNTAISTLKTELNTVQNDVAISLAVVTFSSAGAPERVSNSNDNYNEDDNQVDAWQSVGWTSLNNFNFALNADDCDGGTNWQAGVRMGENLLSSRPAENRKYVLFLTDGDPTFRYKEGSGTITQGQGNADSDDKNFNAAVSEWNNSSNLKATVARYVIDANPTGTNKCDEFATAINATELPGNNSTTMSSSFKKIAGDIIKPSYKNVSIEDTLSDYVNFADPLNLEVYKVVTNEDKTEIKTRLTESDYTHTISGKTITINLLNGNALEDKVTYRASFDIITTNEAYYEYETNGYGDTKGDPNTDALGNDTSSDKPGLHSNAEAKVNYQINDNPSATAEYDHPVVQVKKETVNHTVQKTWEGNQQDSVRVQLIAKATVDGTEVSLTNETYKSISQSMEIILDSSNSWTYTWNDLPQYYYYKDSDSNIQKTEISYSVDEPTVPEGYEKSVATDGTTTTITNKELSNLVVSKIWSDYGKKYGSRPSSIILQLQRRSSTMTEENWESYGNPITLTEDNKTETDDNVWSYTFEHVPSGYDYRVVETSVPSGYHASECTADADGNLSIINVLNWNLVKVSSSSDDQVIKLEGAEFELNDNDKTYTGTSDSNGVVTWKSGEDNITIIPDGTYTLKEAKAPAGYQLGSEVTITIENGLPTITESGSEVEVGTLKASWDDGSKTMNVYYADDVLYELPSAGGSGIYWYLIGGVLLMMAATLILYRNKNLRRC